jgi:hypothetical protein
MEEITHAHAAKHGMTKDQLKQHVKLLGLKTLEGKKVREGLKRPDRGGRKIGLYEQASG